MQDIVTGIGIFELLAEQLGIGFLNFDFFTSEQDVVEFDADIEERVIDHALELKERGLPGELGALNGRTDAAAGEKGLGRGQTEIPSAVRGGETLGNRLVVELVTAGGGDVGNRACFHFDHNALLLLDAFAGLADREVIIDREA